MALNIPCCHTFGVHREDLRLNVLTDAGLSLFQQLRVKFTLPVSGDIHFHVAEAASTHIVATINGERTTYVLPEQQNELHSLIFGTENVDILDNLLGAFYVDQEKGWTLLNRGVAIGSIHFIVNDKIISTFKNTTSAVAH